MNNYSVGFIGRKKGSIGSFEAFRIEVEASHPSEVRGNLYKKYENIEGLGVRLLDSDEDEQLDADYRRPETNYGSLASSVCGVKAPLEVLQNEVGIFYIGTREDFRPLSRESQFYFQTEEEAQEALDRKWWIQKGQP